jgi:hypothetical protein
MDKVAGSLLNNVIEFFGILLPGVVLAYLHSAFLHAMFGPSVDTGKAEISADWSWILVFVVSLILGHFLHAFSDFLDDYANRFYVYPHKTKSYFDAAISSITLPKDAEKTPKNYFYFVFSFIRVHHAGAVAELERQAADFKFFRSLALLFLLEIGLSGLDPYTRDAWLQRAAVSFLMMCLAAATYKLLLEWAYQLAFELYIQIREFEKQLAAKLAA